MANTIDSKCFLLQFWVAKKLFTCNETQLGVVYEGQHFCMLFWKVEQINCRVWHSWTLLTRNVPSIVRGVGENRLGLADLRKGVGLGIKLLKFWFSKVELSIVTRSGSFGDILLVFTLRNHCTDAAFINDWHIEICICYIDNFLLFVTLSSVTPLFPSSLNLSSPCLGLKFWGTITKSSMVLPLWWSHLQEWQLALARQFIEVTQ